MSNLIFDVQERFYAGDSIEDISNSTGAPKHMVEDIIKELESPQPDDWPEPDQGFL
jgi:hypothetical protein